MALLCMLAGGARAASRGESPNPPIVRISTELVQLDAVVTDKKGHPVTDLQPGDFTILQDGRPQRISSLSFVRVGGPAGVSMAAGTAPSPATEAAKGTVVRAETSSPRTILFVVDDLSLSPFSFPRTRWALKAIMQTLGPGDRVDLVTTAHGFKQLQPTADRKVLLAAVESMRRTPWTRDDLTASSSSQSTFFALQQGGSRYDFDDWNSRLALQSMAVIKQAVKALRPLPGRKTLLLVSEGFVGLTSLGGSQIHDIYWPLDALYGDADDVRGALKRLGDFAARAGVVIDAVDPRGLMTGGTNAEDPSAFNNGGAARKVFIQYTQGTLQSLTDETGGRAMLDSNDLSGAISTLVSDLTGYYLIGYQPAAGTFSGSGFHDVTVKVSRPDVRVRSRKGFFAVTDEQVAEAMK